jgi:hypothetical protein
VEITGSHILRAANTERKKNICKKLFRSLLLIVVFVVVMPKKKDSELGVIFLIYTLQRGKCMRTGLYLNVMRERETN